MNVLASPGNLPIGSTAANATSPAIPGNRSGDLDQRFALDVQGVDVLRRTNKNSPAEGIKQVSRQFEAMFMQMVLKSMRDATPSDGPFDSQQTKTYTSMLDQQLSQNLSGRGLGLAEAMAAQLTRDANQRAQPPDGSQNQTGPAPLMPLSPKQSLYLLQDAQQLSQLGLQQAVAIPNLSFYEAASGKSARPANAGSTSQATIQQFVSDMAVPAQAASQATGLPSQLILAQAALESGWGRREVKADDGTQSYNLFGIKAGKNWTGPVVEAATTEYVNGAAQHTRATFRAYGSYQEAFTDYANFLASNPRYANVLATRDPAAAAYGLQRAGYATDPQYGDKLVRIMQQIS